MQKGKLIFKPHFIQNCRGPYIDDYFFLSDENGDPFHSDCELTKKGIEISDTEGRDKFALHVRWNVEGFGYLYLTADNSGNYYSLSGLSDETVSLNYELASTHAILNERRLDKFVKEGFTPSRELSALHNLGMQYLEDSKNEKNNEVRTSEFAQHSLKNSLWASDLLEFEKAKWDIEKFRQKRNFFFGCDSRGYFQMERKELFLEYFSELFNFATITHYLIGDIVDFEKEEGKKQFAPREEVLKELRKRNITIEGRPLFWTHRWVTPEWLKRKSFDELKSYLEKHIKEVVKHYGDEIQIWEVVNELHDWANEIQLNPEQTIELTKFACDIARDTNPRIKLLINNCCPFAEYIQKGKWLDIDAKYPMRTPYQFTKQLIEAGVDFDIIGVQVYFTQRSAADAIRIIERYGALGKKIHLAEVGAPSFGTAKEFIDTDESEYSTKPYEWHRHWDEELQADWLEYIFTYAYSQPFIEAANWYDFVDPHTFLKKGGLLRSPKGERKAAVDRLLKLKQKWELIS